MRPELGYAFVLTSGSGLASCPCPYVIGAMVFSYSFGETRHAWICCIRPASYGSYQLLSISVSFRGKRKTASRLTELVKARMTRPPRLRRPDRAKADCFLPRVHDAGLFHAEVMLWRLQGNMACNANACITLGLSFSHSREDQQLFFREWIVRNNNGLGVQEPRV